MKTVMLVDDELLARLGMKSLIDWEAEGFAIVCEADNGSQALTLARQHAPDIIITDVKMPVMDGIELIGEIKRQGIKSKVIVTSAYSDFAYVKQALQNGAADYLLKLELEADGLLQVLRKVAAGVAATNDGQAGGADEELRAMKRDELLQSLLFHRPASEGGVRAGLEGLDMVLPGRFFCVKLFLPAVAQGGTGLNRLKGTVSGVLQKIIDSYGGGFYTQREESVFYVVIAPGEAGAKALDIRKRAAGNLVDMLSMMFGLDCYAGVSEPMHERGRLYDARKQADGAAEAACFSAKKILCHEDIRQGAGLTTLELETRLASIEKNIHSMDSLATRGAFGELLDALHSQEFVQKESLRGACHTLIYVANDCMAASGIPTQNLWGEGANPYDEIQKLGTLGEYIGWLELLAANLAGVMNPANDSLRLVMEAKKVIRSQYRENISLEAVAEQLAVSPNHLSKLFKKAGGAGFVEYVTEVRMREAAALLQSGKYKVYEVAEMTGYDNATYFSRVFKKHTGKSPYSYKNEV